MNGAKTLVLDPSLAGPLSLVTEVALLKVRVPQTYRLNEEGIDPRTAPWGRQDVLVGAWTSLCHLAEYRIPV